MPGKVTLTVVVGSTKGDEFVFREHDTCLCGRQENNRVYLPGDELISRHHCILEIVPPNVSIRDLGSKNGIYIDGKKYGGRADNEFPEEGSRREYPTVSLQHGSKVGIGKTLLHVSIEVPKKESKKLRCQQCKKEVAVEVDAERQGIFLCAACRRSALSDPKILFDQEQKSTPEIIPGYRLLNELGRGGMGVVYLVQNMTSKRLAALKIMLPHLAVNEVAQLKFLREIETTRALQHRHIVTFIEGGIQKGAFYFLLEYCDAGNLYDLLKRRGGKLSLNEAGPIMLQALQGLASAHKQGFIHRDLKPQNILLSGQEGRLTAKIGDMGLAKSFEEAGFSGMTVTSDGFVGSLPYIPREQIINYKYVKPVSDVWAIGATFYYLLTGQLPRMKQQGEDTINMILYGQSIPIRQRNPSIPPPVAAIIDRSLESEASDRYQNAGEMYAELAKVL